MSIEPSERAVSGEGQWLGDTSCVVCTAAHVEALKSSALSNSITLLFKIL